MKLIKKKKKKIINKPRLHKNKKPDLPGPSIKFYKIIILKNSNVQSNGQSSYQKLDISYVKYRQCVSIQIKCVHIEDEIIIQKV